MADTVKPQIYDIAIVGGGINGCGIARDAAGRGLDVFLAEQGDLAQGTSSASTKLIHGGLRYLEYYEFRLVREALIEREVLLRNAPHIISPLRFVLPHHAGLRPAWLLRLGLFLYDHLGGRKLLPATRVLDLRSDVVGGSLVEGFRKGFEYSDAWVDDARLVVLNALDAQRLGARIETRSRVTSAKRQDGLWQIEVQPVGEGASYQVLAHALVNAAGPWVDQVIKSVGEQDKDLQPKVRLVRGSHIVVPRIFDHERAYIFQNKDGRIIFAIPYEKDFTLIGTTDVDHHAGLDAVHAHEDEINYLCKSASEYFKEPVQREDVIWTYSGVRSLYDDGADAAHQATRDYVLQVEDQAGHAPLLNVFGGKITTYRRLAGSALQKLVAYLSIPDQDWTRSAPLPGGHFAPSERDTKLAALKSRYPFLQATTAARLLRTYGELAQQVLGNAQNLTDLGEHFGADLYQLEVEYLIEHEWVLELDDLIWRRTKLGLRLDEAQKAHLGTYLRTRIKNHSSTGAAV